MKNNLFKDKQNVRFSAVLVALSVGVAGVGFLSKCRREPLTDNVRAPVKGDGRCERDKGEADYLSSTFDPASCGFCGDGVRQQEETPENCPVDFHCGNGRLEQNAVYGALVRKTEHVFAFETVAITESCESGSPNFCPADCGDGGGRVLCRPEVSPPIVHRLHAQLGSNASSLRAASGVGAETGLIVRVHVLVTADGVPSVESATVGAPGVKPVALPPSTLSLEGVSVGAPGEDCVVLANVSVPPG